jgi:holliday junction DNA helicase RuvA
MPERKMGMYAYLKGTLEQIEEDRIVVEVAGIGYNVHVSATTIQSLPSIGEPVVVYTYTLVREDAFLLYGFLTRSDLEIFRKLITVGGIGPKGGLAILSVMDADTLRFAIISGDAKAIAKAPGIGNKTAERVILDLKDKISIEDTLRGESAVPALAGGMDASEKGKKQEAIEALTALGYSASEAAAAVRKVKTDDDTTVEAILKDALKNMF